MRQLLLDQIGMFLAHKPGEDSSDRSTRSSSYSGTCDGGRKAPARHDHCSCRSKCSDIKRSADQSAFRIANGLG